MGAQSHDQYDERDEHRHDAREERPGLIEGERDARVVGEAQPNGAPDVDRVLRQRVSRPHLGERVDGRHREGDREDRVVESKR